MNRFLSIAHFATKVVLLLLCFSFVCSTASAKKKSIQETKYDIEGVEVGTQGTYLVKVYVYTKNSTATAEEFKFAAVHGVIFKGFTGKGFSAQKPLARIETQNQHADFYNAFFDNGDYAGYATVVTPNADRMKIGKEYKIAAGVSVSKDELRKALEAAGVVRNLNSGF